MVENEMDVLAELLDTDREEAFKRVAHNTPIGWISSPEDIAGIFTYLASDESRYMTGAELVIDGGGSVVDPGTMIFRR